MPLLLLRSYEALFLTLPWTFEWPIGAARIALPTEVFIAWTSVLAAYYLFRLFKGDARAFLRDIIGRTGRGQGRLIALSSALWLSWQWIAAIGSSMPVVSMKYMLVETAHVWVFFVVLLCWQGAIPRLLRLFAFSMMCLAVYALARHGFYYRFHPHQSILSAEPFFFSHTLYAATLTFALFASAGLLRRSVLGVAWLAAFSKAAWASGLLAFVAYLLKARFEQLRPGETSDLKNKRRFALGGALVLLAGLIVFYPQLRDLRGKPEERDVSAMERNNRYACALRMAYDRPWLGFGPGTFPFQYLPYQRPEEMTRISVTTPVAAHTPLTRGRGGGAHSEYLQALSETGWPGLLLYCFWVGALLMAVWRSSARPSSADSAFMTPALYGLVAFFAHAAVNNFFHDARIAAWVWALAAYLAPPGPPRLKEGD